MTVTGSDVIFPCFFLTIVVVQNVPLHMTGSNMTTGYEGHVTGSDVTGISPEVCGSPWGVFGYVRGCCVVLQVVYHVLLDHFCNIFRDLLTFYSLIVRFCYFFFVNFLAITTFLDSFL
jgi:hypothetical protein